MKKKGRRSTRVQTRGDAIGDGELRRVADARAELGRGGERTRQGVAVARVRGGPERAARVELAPQDRREVLRGRELRHLRVEARVARAARGREDRGERVERRGVARALRRRRGPPQVAAELAPLVERRLERRRGVDGARREAQVRGLGEEPYGRAAVAAVARDFGKGWRGLRGPAHSRVS